MICSNCKADVPDGKGGKNPKGEFVCCEHCAFNPLGCRCQYGEFGVPETLAEHYGIAQRSADQPDRHDQHD